MNILLFLIKFTCLMWIRLLIKFKIELYKENVLKSSSLNLFERKFGLNVLYVVFSSLKMKLSMVYTSCGTIDLMVLSQFSDICRPQGYGFHPIKNYRNCAVKMLHCFFAIFIMKLGARTTKHIYFVSLNNYLHSSILTYLAAIMQLL